MLFGSSGRLSLPPPPAPETPPRETDNSTHKDIISKLRVKEKVNNGKMRKTLSSKSVYMPNAARAVVRPLSAGRLPEIGS